MIWLTLIGGVIVLAAISGYVTRNKSQYNHHITSQRRSNYDRDFIIGSICTMVESQLGRIGTENFVDGKLVISKSVASVGWVGKNGNDIDSGHEILCNLEEINQTDKDLLKILLDGVRGAEGMQKMIAVDMAAMAIHKCLLEYSNKYNSMPYRDPRLS